MPRRTADANEKGPRLTLAQRYGLAPAPGPKLSQQEWTEVHCKSLTRNDLKHGCPICCEEFKDEEQVLLSCSHVFHRKCVRSFEKFSKQRVCPICRQEEYQKKCILDARERYLERSAVAIQAAFRGYRMRKWYHRVRESDAPKDPVSRREYYADQLGDALGGGGVDREVSERPRRSRAALAAAAVAGRESSTFPGGIGQ